MNTDEKLKLIHDRLSQAFSPTLLEVHDESDQHMGHAGHQGGGRHFSVVISSPLLAGKSKVEAHREIYSHFQDLMPHEVHALKIKII